MNEDVPPDLKTYFRSAESWSADREQGLRATARTMTIVAAVLGVIALVEAIALIVLMPLKTVEPYTLLVDRQTGYVQALKPLSRETIAPDTALTRSFLAQYVMAREGFDIDSLRDDYRRVTLWSTDEARARYIAVMQAGNPESPLARLPRHALVEVRITAISSLANNVALVRFQTVRTDPGGQTPAIQPWQAVIAYRFSGGAMSAADRLLNPLGFQVTRYRRDAEIPPEPIPTTAAAVATVPAPAAVTSSPTPPAAIPFAAPGASTAKSLPQKRPL